RLKIRAIMKLGGFSSDVKTLKTFEDCYIRAQYEAYKMGVDPVKEAEDHLKGLQAHYKEVTDPKEKKKLQAEIARAEAEQKKLEAAKEREEQHKQQIDNLVAALKRGLALHEAKKMKASIELNNARALMAYWAMQTGKLEDAIAAGETFARNDPRSAQASIPA